MKYLHMRILTAPPLPRICALSARDDIASKSIHIGYTVEKPWRDNKSNISCIPAGEYKLFDHRSSTKNKWRSGRVLALINPDLGISLNQGESRRHHCYIHSANKPSELRGCIAPGMVLNESEYGVIDSRTACNEIFEYFEDGHTVLIIE